MCIKKQTLILQAGEEKVRKIISAVGVLLPLCSALCFVSEKVVRGKPNTMPFYREIVRPNFGGKCKQPPSN